ncbi:MAG: alpha/beta hydrolase [Chloroflexia bacterium]|nr:alpha/beta hydrolase [Chloroflexia bacterium]
MSQVGTRTDVREVALPQGTLRYRDTGSGPPLVFVHGILVNGTLWRDVVASLDGRFRCVVPDLPLGGHSVPMSDGADLTPTGVADLLAAFMAALDLRAVTLVGNDTGGAICQILITRHPERIARLVLTNCDAYDAFFPALFGFVHHGPRLFGERFTALLGCLLQTRVGRRVVMWTVSHRRQEPWVLDAYLAPLGDPAIRRDVTKFLAAVSRRYTLEAAESFAGFRRPVLIAWGRDDFLFRPRLARRLQRDFPDAALVFLPRSRAFVPEDQPQRLADLIRAFVPAADAVARAEVGAPRSSGVRASGAHALV